VQNFTPLALKHSEKIEEDGRSYCKNAKFQTAPYGTKILSTLIFALKKLIKHNRKTPFIFKESIHCFLLLFTPPDPWILIKQTFQQYQKTKNHHLQAKK